MTSDTDQDSKEYVVVINDEEQYSIWRSDREIPSGWRDEGTRGPKARCLEHIDEVWTDMRPRSVREAMAKMPEPEALPATPPRSDLVERLASAQPLAFVGRPESSRDELGAQLERGRVFVRFESTGTELGLKLNAGALSSARAAFQASASRIALEADLILDYRAVRFHGELELASLRGHGRLETLPEARRD